MSDGTPGNADVPVGSLSCVADEDVGVPRVMASHRTREWYSRGYLPHRDAPRLIQSVTYRLADSLPQEKLRLLSDELAGLADDRVEIERRKRIEEWLDAGMGCCALAHPEVARFVQNSFLHFHGERYNLHAWCVMPNHVHILVEPLLELAVIVQGWKSFTARWILRQNQRLGLQIPESNQLWMREYWDRYIRDAEHYRRAMEYIHQNPVKAKLCRAPEDWPWSSGNAHGSADVLVGNTNTRKRADEDVGAPSRNINMQKTKILFLCTGNSCRSQMAEGWAKALKGDVIEAYSAGIETHGLNPNAVKVMAEAGVDISGHQSKATEAVKDIPFDYVVTVCGHANETCPAWLGGKAKVVHVGFDDPPALAKDARTETEALDHYRRVRDEIRAFVERLPGNLAG